MSLADAFGCVKVVGMVGRWGGQYFRDRGGRTVSYVAIVVVVAKRLG